MEWRCEWCGKPHEEDDPPCDSCGHHKFEEAVVRVTDPGGDVERSPVWACTECGREHQKHSPPCSRCGNATLEKRQPDYSDVENLGGTRWLDVLERKHLAGFVVAGVLAAVLGMGALGVVDVPGMGPPDPPNAPGSSEVAANLSLDVVEREYVEALNRRRAVEGLESVSRGSALDGMAEYYNKRRVVAAYGNASDPTFEEIQAFDPSCPGTNRIFLDPGDVPLGEMNGTSLRAYPNESAFAESLQTVERLDREGGSNVSTLWERRSIDSVGVDVHVAPDEHVFVTAFAC